MDTYERIAATEAIKQLKARYFRGVDDGDGERVRSILAEDCILDYRGCCTDPLSGIDHMPAMNLVIEGRCNWHVGEPVGNKVVTVHQGNDPDIIIHDSCRAEGIWPFSDLFFLPAGAPFERLCGWGRYYET